MRVTRVVVGKGLTSRPSEREQWFKQYYEIEFAINDDRETEAAKQSGVELINGWLSADKAVAAIPKLTIDIEAQPWKTFKKQPAKSGDAAWLFSDSEGVGSLVQAIKAAGGKLQLGMYEFKLSGEKEQFINRVPLKR